MNTAIFFGGLIQKFLKFSILSNLFRHLLRLSTNQVIWLLSSLSFIVAVVWIIFARRNHSTRFVGFRSRLVEDLKRVCLTVILFLGLFSLWAIFASSADQMTNETVPPRVGETTEPKSRIGLPPAIIELKPLGFEEQSSTAEDTKRGTPEFPPTWNNLRTRIEINSKLLRYYQQVGPVDSVMVYQQKVTDNKELMKDNFGMPDFFGVQAQKERLSLKKRK